MVEGELRSKELSTYLEKIRAEKCVWISEDATAIVQKINYDAATNQIIGLVLPLNEKTGCPVTLSYKARTVDEIKKHMEKQKSSIVYLVMAQPINEKHPPFILQLFGSGNVFTAQDVVNRWEYTRKELQKYGIAIAGISSDGDPRLLSAMCHQMFSEKACDMAFVQDSVHIGTKLRNRLLKPGLELQMGTEKVSVQHLKSLIIRCSKEIHGLSLTDVSPEDRQNFSSLQKTTLPRVLNALEQFVPASRGTIKYLQLCRDVTSSYMDFELTPTERIVRIWRATYFFRIWREFLKSSKHRLDEKFITPNAFKCIEINARNLLILIRKFRDEKTSHLFIPTLFQSQTCEKTFRQFRSMGTVNFTKINFSVLELLYMIRRIETQNEILHIKLLNKGIIFPKFQIGTHKTKIFRLPLEEEIIDAMRQAKLFAIEDAKQFGMNIDENIITNYQVPYQRVLTKNDNENVDENDSSNEEYFDEFLRNSEFDEFHETDDNNDNESEHLDEKSKFVMISTDGGSKKIMLKSSLVWLLSEKEGQLSKDRLKRVQSTSINSKFKRARNT